MASTICDFTAVPRRPDSLSGLLEVPPNDALDRNPLLVPPIHLLRQATILATLAIARPLWPSVLRTVDIALDLHCKDYGATVSLFSGNLVGSKRFAVSIYPERTVELIAPPTARELLAFTVANLDILLLPDRALGTWCASTNRHVLDVVLCVGNEHAAQVLGKRYRQVSIYDLALRQEISMEAPEQRRVLAHRAEATTR